jgi:hypothetical protein
MLRTLVFLTALFFAAVSFAEGPPLPVPAAPVQLPAPIGQEQPPAPTAPTQQSAPAVPDQPRWQAAPVQQPAQVIPEKPRAAVAPMPQTPPVPQQAMPAPTAPLLSPAPVPDQLPMPAADEQSLVTAESLPVPAVLEQPAVTAEPLPVPPIQVQALMPAAQELPPVPQVTPQAPVSLPPVADDKAPVTPPVDSAKMPAAADPSKCPPSAPAPEADKLGALEKQLAALAQNLTITTGDPNIKVLFGGALIGDLLYNTARPVAPGTPFFLAPRLPAGFNQQTFDGNARQSTLFALISGPQICGFESGGFIAVCFYDSSLIQDLYGVLPFQAYLQLKNEDWRFAAGVQFDIFNPLNPTVLPFSYLAGSGNAGAGFPAQARAERYFHLDNETQVTVTAGISNPISTTVNNNLVLSEDNGWPNVEGRLSLGLGPMTGEGLLARRPFEVGVSGLVGQVRDTVPGVRQMVASVWGLGGDARWRMTDRFGAQGEVFVGQTLGTYTAGILQNVNPVSFAGIHATGGWAELYYYLCPETWHTHWGYGIDDPLDRDLAPGQPLRNSTLFANLIWDPNKYFRWGVEFTYRKTAYSVLRNNDGVGIESQIQFRF